MYLRRTPLASGFPPKNKTAPPHRRFVGLYYWSAYWRSWERILDVKPGGVWVVQEVDLNLNPIGDVREHRSPMWADRFAGKPFDVAESVMRAG